MNESATHLGINKQTNTLERDISEVNVRIGKASRPISSHPGVRNMSGRKLKSGTKLNATNRMSELALSPLNELASTPAMRTAKHSSKGFNLKLSTQSKRNLANVSFRSGFNDTLTNLDVRQSASNTLYSQMAVAKEIEQNQYDLEDSLSALTLEKNEEVTRQLYLSNKIRANREEQTYKFAAMKNVDCLTMVSTLKQECNTLNYKLKRIVADKDSQSLLIPKKTEKVDVIPETYMFYKIQTKDM